MTRGRFITLEGCEGAGKTTQVRLLEAALAARGLRVLRTREPGGSPGAEVLRDLLLNGQTAWSLPAEILLHFAARAEHVERVVRPALADGVWVVCDRFTDSTMAYQGYGQGGDRSMIATLTRLLGLEPDLTVVLDVSVDTGAARLLARGAAADRYERLGRDFHQRVADGFRAIARAAPMRCAVIDASGAVADVHAGVLDAVDARLGPDARP